MSLELWNTMFNAVADAIIALFGYFFTVVGAATTALLALAILSAVIRLIVKPIIGYKLDALDLGSNLRRGDMKARAEKMREKRKHNKSGDK